MHFQSHDASLLTSLSLSLHSLGADPGDGIAEIKKDMQHLKERRKNANIIYQCYLSVRRVILYYMHHLTAIWFF